jgi:hypothetical protein
LLYFSFIAASSSALKRFFASPDDDLLVRVQAELPALVLAGDELQDVIARR